MHKEIPKKYQQYLKTHTTSLLADRAGQQKLSFRAFWVGAFLSFFLAIGAPYGNMVLRGSYMAWDFITPGAIFLFLFLIGILNLLFKLTARSILTATLFAGALSAAYFYAFWPFNELDPYSPGWIFSSFVLISSLVNIPVVARRSSLALNRSDLIVVYIMLLIVSSLCTLGLSEQILPVLTAIFYYASPENRWVEMLFPHFPKHPILVNDGSGNKAFFEGVSQAGQRIPYEAWVEPLCWWGILLLALYVTMVSIAVILRRQWMERERLPYPIIQVPLAMVRGEEGNSLINRFFKSWSMRIGCVIPLIVGSLQALQQYNPVMTITSLNWTIPFLPHQFLQVTISFATLGFCYLINTKVAAGIWIFHVLSKCEKELFLVTGIQSKQIAHGTSAFPFLAYQGIGALIAMALLGLWIGRDHLKNVFLKALGKAPQIDDTDEILSYRSALVGSIGGILIMVGWMWLMGTPLWISILFINVAMLVFIGITRIVAEAGLAVLRSPMTAPDLIVQGLGSGLVGSAGVFNLSLTYIWTGGIRVFVMGVCANGLKLIEEMDRSSRRYVFWSIILALLIGTLGSFWMIFHLAYQYGGINLNHVFFKNVPSLVYDKAVRNMALAEIYWPGLGFFFSGGTAMAVMILARQRLPWWPLHPIGLPLSATRMMDYVWFSVFLAWLIKLTVLKYGGAAFYRRSQKFFLGLIAGQMLCSGMWLVIDYLTGKTDNIIFIQGIL